jgi:AcrR family transcriptional regulator
MESGYQTDTRLKLLVAAGELFAERGMNGTSVRDIVTRASATLSSVNYYFGSKKELYFETIRYALNEKVRLDRVFVRFAEEDLTDSQEISNELCRNIRALFMTLLNPD